MDLILGNLSPVRPALFEHKAPLMKQEPRESGLGGVFEKGGSPGTVRSGAAGKVPAIHN